MKIFALVRCFSAKSSTLGREFYFGILPFYDVSIRSAGNNITIDVTNVSPNDVRIRMQIPYFNNDSYYNVPTEQNKTVIIPPSLQRDGTFKDSRGIRITSDGDVSVVVSNRYNNENTMDVYNVLPTTSLGRRYMIASYRATRSDVLNGCTFLVTGVYNNTYLTVSINDSSHFVHLNALDVYQYTCRGQCDLSGSHLNSDKNISVTAGVSYSDSLINGSDYFASEMIPTPAWTTTYIVPPLYPQPGFTFRVMSEYDTIITLSNTSHSLSIKADLQERYFENLPVLASSNQSFSVYQYGVRYNYTGDPFMAFVPGIEQYINDYMFMVPQAVKGSETKSYIALIVPLRNKDTLILDGTSVQSRVTNVGDIRQLDVPHPFDNYTVLTFETTEGVHHFWHPQRDVTFGVFVYEIGNVVGYGFYAGYDLQGTEGTTVDMLTTKENSFHPLTEDIPDTTTAYVTEGIFILQRLICYTCNDLTHPDLCDTVQKCASKEVCFVKTFTESGHRKFHSGCFGSDVSTSVWTAVSQVLTMVIYFTLLCGRRSDVKMDIGKRSKVCKANQNNKLPSDEQCFECCHTDYCNNKPCGKPGIPDRNTRGPICFDCQHVSSLEECHKVTPCEHHQVCRIEENKWFEHSHFKLGCGDSLCDPVSRVLPLSHVLKRATPVCYACCSDDYCNRNCTIQNGHPNVPNIIG